MNYIKSLFLQSTQNPTVLVNSNQHIYRSRHAEHGFVRTPLLPKLKESECIIGKVWTETVKSRKDKHAFGYRPLINVSVF